MGRSLLFVALLAQGLTWTLALTCGCQALHLGGPHSQPPGSTFVLIRMGRAEWTLR